MSGLEEEFADNVRARNVDATTATSMTAVKQLGFGRHGLVIRSATGKVLFKQTDHTVDLETVREFLGERFSS